MKTLNKSLVAMSFIGVTSAVMAGTMGPVTSTWTGVYAGLNAGVIWGDNEFIWNNYGSAFTAPSIQEVSPFTNVKLSDTGFIGGGQIGGNYQWNSFVLGAEIDLDYNNLDRQHTVNYPGNVGLGLESSVINENFSSDWLSTIRGRLGFASDSWLIYGTGGFALAELNLFDEACSASGCRVMSQDKTDWGWTAGAGVEWKFSANLSAKVEYLYVDLGDAAYTSLFALNGSTLVENSNINHHHDFSANIARVGVNYWFS